MSEIREANETSEAVTITIGSKGVSLGDVAAEASTAGDEQAETDLFALSLTGKKKKKKRKAFKLAEVEEPKPERAAVEKPEPVRETESHKEGSERLASEWRPYEYAEMLEMIYERMRKRGSSMFARGGYGGGQFVVQPPQVIRLGTKKSGFANFGEIAKSIGREQSHLQRFLDVELGTNSQLDGAGILVLKGKFGRGEVEKVLRGYIRQYVRCPTCGGHSTRIERDRATRLNFMVCNECSARSSMAEVEQGFRALTEKRSRIRRREGN